MSDNKNLLLAILLSAIILLVLIIERLIMLLSFWISKNLLRGKIPGAAIAILIGLGLAFLGDKKGISDIPIFAGIAVFLIFRLRKVLGRKTGFEKKQQEAQIPTDNIVKDRNKEINIPDLEEDFVELKKAYEVIEGFDHKDFFDGAKIAFETIPNSNPHRHAYFKSLAHRKDTIELRKEDSYYSFTAGNYDPPKIFDLRKKKNAE